MPGLTQPRGEGTGSCVGQEPRDAGGKERKCGESPSREVMEMSSSATRTESEKGRGQRWRRRQDMQSVVAGQRRSESRG